MKTLPAGLKKLMLAAKRSGAGLMLLSAAALAQPYPSKPINMLVAIGPGSPQDVVTRILVTKAVKMLGQPFVVTNNGAAGGAVALASVARAKPDGYQLISNGTPMVTMMPQIRTVPFKLQDFEPIMHFGAGQYGLAVRADSPSKTLAELVEFARKNPGSVRYSSSGATGIERFAIERLQQVAEFQITIIPFKGSSEATTALLGKHVELTTAYLPDLKRYFDAGTLKPIVSLGFDRNDLPVGNIATARDAGYDVVGVTYSGLLAPQGTPQAVVSQLHDAFKQAEESREFRESMERLGVRVRYMNGEAFLQQIKLDYETNGKLIRALGIK